MSKRRLELILRQSQQFFQIQDYQPVYAYNRERFVNLKRNMRRKREPRQSNYQR